MDYGGLVARRHAKVAVLGCVQQWFAAKRGALQVFPARTARLLFLFFFLFLMKHPETTR